MVGETVNSQSLTVFSVHLQCIFKVNGLFVEVMIVYSSSKKMFLLSGSTYKNLKKIKSYHLGVCPFWPIFYPFISETTRARSNRVEKRISRDSDPLYKQRDKKRTSISYRDRKEHKKDRKG
jgi:hypothetical protein